MANSGLSALPMPAVSGSGFRLSKGNVLKLTISKLALNLCFFYMPFRENLRRLRLTTNVTDKFRCYLETTDWNLNKHNNIIF